MSSDALMVALTARSDRYGSDDDRWLDQVAELRRNLRAETGAVQPASAAVPGMKGTVDELIVALGSAGAFTTTVEMLRVWLARDRTRSIHAEWTDDNGTQREVTLSAQNADSRTLAPLVEAVSRKIGAVP